MTPILRTPRLILRPLADADAGWITAAMQNRAIWEWLTVIPQPYTESNAVEFIRDIAPKGHTWAITKDGVGIGVIGASDELGYWLDEPAWGQGIITEAGSHVVEWLFQNNHQTLQSGHFEQNDRSRRALEKLGFVDAGAKVLGCLSDGRTDIPSRHMQQARADWVRRNTHDLGEFRLRPKGADDAGALVELFSNWDVTRQLGSWTYPPDPEQIAARAANCAPGFVWVIETDRLVGTVGVSAGPNGSGGIGYCLHPDHWGQGMMSRAARHAIDHAAARYGLTRINASTWYDNPASARVLEKLGFRYTHQSIEPAKARDADVLSNHFTLDLRAPAA